MKKEVLFSKELCREEAVLFVASRYGVTPEQILTRYLVQQNIINSDTEYDYELAANELALFHDLGAGNK